jgi:hypothetical protein
VRTASSGRAFPVVLCVIVLAIAVVSTYSIAGRATAAKNIDGAITVPLPECDVAAQIDADGFCRFTGTGIQQISQTGEPSIPYKTVTVLLPPNTNLSTVRARITDCQWTSLDGEWDIPPVPPFAAEGCENTLAVSPTDKAIFDGKDADIYETDVLFPLEPVRKVDVQVMRQWKMVEVFYAPYAYNPVEKHIFQLSGKAIEITFERDLLKSSAASTDFTGTGQVREMTANFAEAAGEYGGYAVSADTGRYVIITTSAIEAASDNLTDFVASKEARGFTVQVVTEGTWGGGTGNTAAEHIRTWLKSNYIILNIKYVLLIGNPNPSTGDVPMKMCYPQNADPTYPDCPTDYYAELTSKDWDKDGDGKYGEYWDDFSGNPPRVAGVAVGRIPYYGVVTDLDHILSKIIAYETRPVADVSWRRNILLPMKPSDGSTPGYQLGEEIKDDILVPNSWTYYRVYDSDYGLIPTPDKTTCNVTNVTNAWNGSDFGAVFWWTHGSSTSASDVMDVSHAATLDDAHPSFAFQCSCSNGTPETSNNLGYSLLKNGCISTVSASRVSWYEPGQISFAGTPTNSGMTFEYASRLIADEMYAGDALNDLKFNVSPYAEQLWMNYLDFNLYGCPAVGLFTPPLTETNDATSIATTSARLNGNLDDLGTADNVTVSFEWGTSSGGPYPYQTDNQMLTATGVFSFDLSSLNPGTTYYYKAKATGWGMSYGREGSFTTLIPPSVTTDNASTITTTSARLNGNLDGLGTADNVSVSFQWGTASGVYGNETAPQVESPKGPFYFDLSGLAPGTTFYYRAKASGHGTPQFGTEKEFTTLPTPPSVATNDATGITITSAALNGDLTFLGTSDNVSVSFEWGTSSGVYGNETAPQVESPKGIFHFDLSGLAPGTTFYYRAKADGDGDPVYGDEKRFITGITPPSVTTGDASNIATTTATLNGNLDDLGTAENVTVSFVWGTTSEHYDYETADDLKDRTGAFYFDLSGLAPDTTFYYRAKADGDGDPVHGEKKSFTTLQVPLIANVNPGTGRSGQSMVVGISGSNFTGATGVSFGPEIIVDSFTRVSDTQISAAIRILCDGTAGVMGVSVTTPGGTATLIKGFAITDSPPNQPRNVAPVDKASVMTLTPIIGSSAFSHPCLSRTHTASQWQVTTVSGDYSNPLFNSAVDSINLTSMALPRGVVGEHELYWWRVRYQDSRGIWSDWSTETSFAQPDFIRAGLNGSAEIHVLDSLLRVTGTVGAQPQQQIPYSDFFSDTVTVVSPTDSYRYEVVGTEDGSYTLTVVRLVGNQSIAFHATEIPVSAGEIHQYVIDWDALSRGEPGVTIRIDSNGDGAFDRTALVADDIDSNAQVFADDDHGTPIWVWICLGLLAASAGVFVLSRIAGKKPQADVLPQ